VHTIDESCPNPVSCSHYCCCCCCCSSSQSLDHQTLKLVNHKLCI